MAAKRLTGGDWESRANEYWRNWHRSEVRREAVERALTDALCWLGCHSSMPEAELLAELLSDEAKVPIGPCRGCAS